VKSSTEIFLLKVFYTLVNAFNANSMMFGLELKYIHFICRLLYFSVHHVINRFLSSDAPCPGQEVREGKLLFFALLRACASSHHVLCVILRLANVTSCVDSCWNIFRVYITCEDMIRDAAA
jgi:hypothetical protein